MSGRHPPAPDAWIPLRLSVRGRRVLQAVLYEAVALAVLTPLLAWWFDQPLFAAAGLTVAMSTVAMLWNFVFNAGFEWWEARHPVGGRPWRRRALHGLGFEIGLALMLVPLMAWWLDLTLWQALLADAVLVVGFLLYAIAFTWCFDRVFGLPQSARPA